MARSKFHPPHSRRRTRTFKSGAWVLLNLLVVGVGIGAALVGSLAIFGELHVAALLFGTSLIGISVDYGLFYTSSVFDPAGGTPQERLHRVMPGIAFGLLATLIGYGALALAPFPGLRQIAVFSVIGLLAAVATVVLWLPRLDTGRQARHLAGLLAATGWMFAFWEAPRWRRARSLLVLSALAIALAGVVRFHTDNDVRRMQALSPELVRDQDDVRRLIGTTAATQFLLVEGVDDETALRREEALAPILARLRAEGALVSAQMPAGFVPSAERQRENQTLVRTQLDDPFLARQRASLGMEADAADATGANPGFLTLKEALASEAVPMLGDLVLAPGLHVVALQGLTRPDAVRAAFAGVAGVRLVDPTADFSVLLGKYQLMLVGQSFTFFHAMALVLLLSIANDYAVFSAESPAARRSVTLLAVWMAAMTTLLSFGLLAVSGVPAVHNFGSTMLIGILLAFFAAPLASRGRRKANAPPVHDGVAKDVCVRVV